MEFTNGCSAPLVVYRSAKYTGFLGRFRHYMQSYGRFYLAHHVLKHCFKIKNVLVQIFSFLGLLLFVLPVAALCFIGELKGMHFKNIYS